MFQPQKFFGIFCQALPHARCLSATALPGNDMDWNAIALSAKLSACTAVLLLVFGLPTAWWLANTRFRGRIFIEAVVALPLVLPPTALGYYVLVGLGPRSIPGHWYE